MTELRHPIEQLALDTTEQERFCEFLDATAALTSGWPHSRWSARRWVCHACGVESLGDLGVDQAGAQLWSVIYQRFLDWDLNQELGL